MTFQNFFRRVTKAAAWLVLSAIYSCRGTEQSIRWNRKNARELLGGLHRSAAKQRSFGATVVGFWLALILALAPLEAHAQDNAASERQRLMT